MKYPPAIEKLSRDHWIMQVPVITTGHFTKDDADRLYATAMMTSGDGVMALVCIEDPEEEEKRGISEEAKAVCQQFFALGYRYIRLDPDGMEVEGLKTYEW